MARGDFEPILGWLIENVYAQASRYTPKELVRRITGGALDAKPYLEGITKKYSDIYGL